MESLAPSSSTLLFSLRSASAPLKRAAKRWFRSASISGERDPCSSTHQVAHEAAAAPKSVSTPLAISTLRLASERVLLQRLEVVSVDSREVTRECSSALLSSQFNHDSSSISGSIG